MDLIVAALVLYGIAYAASKGWDELAKTVKAKRSAARTAAANRGGHHNSDAVRRRAARQATAGFWAGEVRHGFPVFRHGFGEGWAEHQHAMAERQRDRAARQADHAEQRATWREQVREHGERVKAAEARGREDASKPEAADPPLADGRTPGSRPAGQQNGQPAPKAAPATEDSTPTTQDRSGTVGDFSYDDTVKTCDDLIAAADSAVNEQDLQKATSLADGLGAMVPEDSTTLGQAADVAQAIKDVQEANTRLQDTTGALKDRVVKTYGSTQEAVDASGERAPQPEFLDH